MKTSLFRETSVLWIHKNVHMSEPLTHVESDGNDVQRHSGVCDAAEWWGLEVAREGKKLKTKNGTKSKNCNWNTVFNQLIGHLLYECGYGLTLSMLEVLGFRRRRRCRLIKREELCSVELLNLNMRKLIIIHWHTLTYEVVTNYLLISQYLFMFIKLLG